MSNFDLKIEHDLKYIYFFKGEGTKDIDNKNDFDEDDFINKGKGLLKKNYIYVTKDDRVVIKNLGIKKKDRTPLTKKIFWDYLVPQIKKGKVKFSKPYIRKLITELLEKDISLAMMRRDVGNLNQYKNVTSIQAQIAQRYGPGLHFLIPNTKGIGVGKGKNFCTMEEFKQHKLQIYDINTDNIWKELNYFIAVPVVKNIFDFVKKEDKEKVLSDD